MTRRHFNAGVAAVGASVLTMGCSGRDDAPSYEELVAETWRHTEGHPNSPSELQRELIRYATLAPNSHNTQAWLFRTEPNRIVILPDYSRRCPVVDPDDHHLYVTLGCAAENLALAAAAFGFRTEMTVASHPETEILIDLLPGRADRSLLFDAIPDRQSTRSTYSGKSAPSRHLTMLDSA